MCFLSPRSYRRLSLLLVGWVPGLRRVPLPQAGAVLFRHALVLVAISPMYSFGMWSPFGSKCLFVTLDRERRFTLLVVSFPI